MQSACVLHAMWSLLEFDPDQNSASQKSLDDGKLVIGGSETNKNALSAAEIEDKATE